MEHQKPLSFLLVKPAGPDCNLACSYCFYSCKAQYFVSETRHRMSDETLELMMRLALNRPKASMGFGWQGGEPTLAGLDFFRKAVELQKEYGRSMRISNALQTNGILIDDQWVDFLKQYSFLVGLSLDGPKHIHDRYRINHAGAGSHEKVEQVAETLVKQGVAVNAIAVINSYSAQFAEETYRYFKELGFEYMQFIPCVETDPDNPKASASFSVSSEQYGKFLCDLFDLWEADWKDGKPTTSVRTLDTFMGMYLGNESAECPYRHTCGDYLVVEHNGDVYSCDHYMYPPYRLGNILEGDPADMVLSERQTALGASKETALPGYCRDCDVLFVCRGGCPKHRFAESPGGEPGLNHLCAGFKNFYHHVDPYMKRMVELVRRGIPVQRIMEAHRPRSSR